jgi:hypothetical protein
VWLAQAFDAETFQVRGDDFQGFILIVDFVFYGPILLHQVEGAVKKVLGGLAIGGRTFDHEQIVVCGVRCGHGQRFWPGSGAADGHIALLQQQPFHAFQTLLKLGNRALRRELQRGHVLQELSAHPGEQVKEHVEPPGPEVEDEPNAVANCGHKCAPRLEIVDSLGEFGFVRLV